MLKPYQWDDTIDIISMLAKYEPGDLVVSKNEDSRLYDIYEYNKLEQTMEWLTTLPVEKLRYICRWSKALLKAVWNYYDEVSVEECRFIGIDIPAEMNIVKLMSEFQSECIVRVMEAETFEDKLYIIEDCMDMLSNEIQIYRQIWCLIEDNINKGGN